MKFKVGDNVRIKGLLGPTMIITGVNDWEEIKAYTCQYFNTLSGLYVTVRFTEECLLDDKFITPKYK